jgi:hypothetical protein
MCFCNNYLLNELATTITEALLIIARIGCYILMSAIKIVMDIGVQAIPGVGKGMDAGLGKFFFPFLPCSLPKLF